VIVIAAVLIASHARSNDAAESFPNRSVRIVVPFPAGGTADILPRILAEHLREKWKQPVIIENRSGAGGNIGAAYVAGSAPDGYTLLASPPGPLAINESLYAADKLGFRPKDFEPVTVMGTVPNVLDVRSSFPAKTVSELVAFARDNPQKVTFASQGNGSTSHLTGLMFEKAANIRMVHVPYRGTAPALQDIMGGTVDIFFDNLGSSLAMAEGKQLRILAVGSTSRNPSLPEVPSLQEAGIAGFESLTWFAVVAPARTSQAIVNRLNKDITDLLKLSAVKEQFVKLAVDPKGGSIEETRVFFESERKKWGGVIKAANISVE
jgi:tripartite-type tricarboxylate transporter receptor subunit TctC